MTAAASRSCLGNLNRVCPLVSRAPNRVSRFNDSTPGQISYGIYGTHCYILPATSRAHKIVVHSSRLRYIIHRLFVMGGTSAYLSASQPVSPPGYLYPPASCLN